MPCYPASAEPKFTPTLRFHALSLLLVWIAGWAAERTGLRPRLQSTTSRQHPTLSIITLGWMALRLLHLRLSATDVTTALQAPPPLLLAIQEPQK